MLLEDFTTAWMSEGTEDPATNGREHRRNSARPLLATEIRQTNELPLAFTRSTTFKARAPISGSMSVSLVNGFALTNGPWKYEPERCRGETGTEGGGRPAPQ